MGEIFAGRYELIDPIGRGGVGMVWRSWDHRRRRYVAAKVLQQSDAHTLLRFVREQALRIDHPHVLAPASWAADDDKVLFTMDLVSGGSLSHLISDYGPLPPTFVCTLLDQLLSGLSAVHAEDVVHRDIKPANILLEPTGVGRPHLRLSDFGISMRIGDPRLTETNYVLGTPGYFAPEQMLGAEVDFTSDLYAVGLVGLYLLTGQKPDSRALFEQYEHGMPAAPQGVPEPMWQVLGQLLQPDPEARFRTATGARKAVVSASEMLDTDATLEFETVEVFDHLGPLPEGFGPEGPTAAPQGQGPIASPGPAPAVPPPSSTGSFHLQPPLTAPAPAPAPAAQGIPEQPGTPPTPTPSGPTQPHPYQPAPGGGTRPYTEYQQGPYSEHGPYSQQAPQYQQAQAPAQSAAHAPPPGQQPAAPQAAGRHMPATPGAYPGQGPVPGPGPGPTPGPGPAATARKPGPPLKVALPVLIVALLCLVAGFWALSSA
ncbi:serine/threonine protein kinase [Streptomyces iconiensis]|uniref:non-specific serine/threonine protein kinase n=1 Tax=Streptomyces iconiensis TaxID=1384038 RepID=A0ABT6ZRG9_9ACTN|nr:serine/threonine-protein kinase [Streptomyces iconiensis]MDJ1131639.1 serine/threonine-protein kinase [Streptomyces iconiensis]